MSSLPFKDVKDIFSSFVSVKEFFLFSFLCVKHKHDRCAAHCLCKRCKVQHLLASCVVIGSDLHVWQKLKGILRQIFHLEVNSKHASSHCI